MPPQPFQQPGFLQRANARRLKNSNDHKHLVHGLLLVDLRYAEVLRDWNQCPPELVLTPRGPTVIGWRRTGEPVYAQEAVPDTIVGAN